MTIRRACGPAPADDNHQDLVVSTHCRPVSLLLPRAAVVLFQGGGLAVSGEDTLEVPHEASRQAVAVVSLQVPAGPTGGVYFAHYDDRHIDHDRRVLDGKRVVKRGVILSPKQRQAEPCRPDAQRHAAFCPQAPAYRARVRLEQ